jgi:RimJ/RimL family protein N-acetyltransferase
VPPIVLPDLVDGDLALRMPTPGDVPAITRICQDPAIQRHTRVPTPYTEEDARSFVLMAIGALAEGTGAHLLAVPAASPTEAVWGCVGVSREPDGTGELGYWIAAEARGRRVATRGARLLSRAAFDHLDVANLLLYAGAGNPASNAVARAIGFRYVGRLRSALVDGPSGDAANPRTDVNLYDLLAGEVT